MYECIIKINDKITQIFASDENDDYRVVVGFQNNDKIRISDICDGSTLCMSVCNYVCNTVVCPYLQKVLSMLTGHPICIAKA